MVIAEALRGSAWARGMTGCMGYGVWLVRKERKESGGAFWSPFSRFTSSEWAMACSSAARRGERRDLARNVIMTSVQLSRGECGEKKDGGRQTPMHNARMEGGE